MVARSAAWKVDVSSFSTVESLLAPFHQLFKRPHWDENFSWQLWLGVRLLTDEAKCSWQLFEKSCCLQKKRSCEKKNCCRQKKDWFVFTFQKGKIHQWDLVYIYITTKTQVLITLSNVMEQFCWKSIFYYGKVIPGKVMFKIHFAVEIYFIIIQGKGKA